MMKSLFSSFISENFWVPQQESNLCLPIVGMVVLPLDYRVSDLWKLEDVVTVYFLLLPMAQPEIWKGGRFLVQNTLPPTIPTNIVNYVKNMFSLQLQHLTSKVAKE